MVKVQINMLMLHHVGIVRIIYKIIEAKIKGEQALKIKLDNSKDKNLKHCKWMMNIIKIKISTMWIIFIIKHKIKMDRRMDIFIIKGWHSSSQEAIIMLS